MDFLEKYCKKYGKMNKGGLSNIDTASKVLLHDWLKGKIPFFIEPPVIQDLPQNTPSHENTPVSASHLPDV